MDLDRDSSMSSFNNGFAAFSAVAQAQQQQQQQQQPLFGVVASSAPVRTDFVPMDDRGTKFTLSLKSPGDLPCPLNTVHELAVFVLNGASIPKDSGVLVYWQVQVSPTVQSGFELLGSLSASSPSGIFRTGWSEREEFQDLSTPIVVNIGISIESLETVQNLVGDGIAAPMATPQVDKRPMVAQKIAENLYNFMLSFDTGGAVGNQTMTVPANIFDRWWTRFEAKLQRDPNFFLKS